MNKKINFVKRSIFITISVVLFVLLSVSKVFANEINLIPNPTFAPDPSNTAIPLDWKFSTYGNNVATSQYPAAGPNASTRGLKTTVSSFTNGFADWFTNSVPVTPYAEYRFSDSYLSNTTGVIEAQYSIKNPTTNIVTNYYTDLAYTSATTTGVWATSSATFVAPAGATSVMIFHFINSVGSLTIANPSLIKTADPSPIFADGANLIPNPTFTPDPTNIAIPKDWKFSTYGTSTAVSSYPTAGPYGNVRGLKTTVSSYTNGFADWFTASVPATAFAEYHFSDSYLSNTTGVIEAQYTIRDVETGATTNLYTDIGYTPATAGAWATSSVTFIAPAGATSVMIFHLINSVGSLTIANPSLIKTADPATFPEGMVSITFDDGNQSNYDQAFPILKAAGLPGTFYIISQSMLDAAIIGTSTGDINNDYMNAAEVMEMNRAGNEIGNHTVNHCNLVTGLCPDTETPNKTDILNAMQEIGQASTTLHQIGALPLDTVSYPYGAYNQTVENTVQNAGLISARSVDRGYNLMTSNRYALKIQYVTASSTTAADFQTIIKPWIDTAIQNHVWLVLLFHQIEPASVITTEKDPDASTPEVLQAVVNYLKQKNVSVVTVHDGVCKMAGMKTDPRCSVQTVPGPIIITPATNTPPTITLKGANPLSLVVNTPFVDPGATAKDLEDGDATTTSHIIVTGTVDASTTGSYTLKYSVTDSGGLLASVTRTVVVVDTIVVPPVTPPVIPPTPPTTPSSNGGGSRPGGHRHSNASMGEVLGATSCSYLRDYLKIDWKNDPIEVLKLQSFLNTYEKENLLLTGKFDSTTFNAVQRFQIKYNTEVLNPWGNKVTTGFVYILTKKKVNEIYCNTVFPLDQVQQNEINTFRAI